MWYDNPPSSIQSHPNNLQTPPRHPPTPTSILIYISWFLVSQLLWIVKKCAVFGVSLGCLEGVWEVSGGCLSYSGYCLGGYDMQAIDKHLIRLFFISFFLFSQLPWIGQNVPYFGVSVGCLECVWQVSGGCLAHSRLCLWPIDAKSIAISPVEMIN